MALCNAVSECGSIYVSIECSASIVQGESYHYELQLTNPDGTPLDLTQYDGILMKLYGENVDLNYEKLYFGYWSWPVPVDTFSNDLYVLQDVDTTASGGGIINEGIIGFDVDYLDSRYFTTGNIYAEIKLKKELVDATVLYTTIPCLKIGRVKSSETKDFFF
jgi:hypothetical protein